LWFFSCRPFFFPQSLFFCYHATYTTNLDPSAHPVVLRFLFLFVNFSLVSCAGGTPLISQHPFFFFFENSSHVTGSLPLIHTLPFYFITTFLPQHPCPFSPLFPSTSLLFVPLPPWYQYAVPFLVFFFSPVVLVRVSHSLSTLG